MCSLPLSLCLSLPLRLSLSLSLSLSPRSRSVVRIQVKLSFEPEKINMFNKDCRRLGKEVTCMSLTLRLRLDARTPARTPLHREGVGMLGWGQRVACVSMSV